jgi:hypothetical protein
MIPAILALALGSGAQDFSDQTGTAGLLFTHDPNQDNYSKTNEGGGTVGDFNNDGWPDLFLIGGGDNADGLFINNGDGTFTNQAQAWGVEVFHRGVAASVGDFDRDGWQDIYVTSGGPLSGEPTNGYNRLYRNNGDGTFTDVAAAAGVHDTSATPNGAAFGDYDLDGDLDLFVCSWVASCCTTTGNRLFRNEGNGTFTDVTVAAGVFSTTIHGFAPQFVDLDGDRYPELLIAADYDSSRYFKNNGDGTFTNLAPGNGTARDTNGMGQTVGDLDRDGLLEWYVTSIFKDSLPPDNGNFLYRNLGAHQFTALESAGATDGGWGWGTAAFDMDHDGWVDLIETNGWTQSQWTDEPSYVFRNNGDLTFTRSSLPHTGQGRALLQLDYDQDGDLDVVICGYREPVMLLRNEIAIPDAALGTANWLIVALDTSGTTLAPNGFGSLVRATVGQDLQVSVITGGCNYLGQGELVAHFGLGAATVIDELAVFWADGRTTVVTDVAVNQRLTLSPPAPAQDPAVACAGGEGSGSAVRRLGLE